MSNGRPWTDMHTAILKDMAGRYSAARIAERTGHTERTIRAQMAAMQLAPYQPSRARWTRRDWLLGDAAGLYYLGGAEEATCAT